MSDETELWHLLIHTPGPNADPSVPIGEAPWASMHRKLHVQLAEAGFYIASGPLPGRENATQILVRGASTDDLTWLATEHDKAVAQGFLEVEIVPWHVEDSLFDFGDVEDFGDEEE